MVWVDRSPVASLRRLDAASFAAVGEKRHVIAEAGWSVVIDDEVAPRLSIGLPVGVSGRALSVAMQGEDAPEWLRSQLLRAVQHPVIAVDRARVVIYWNDAAEDLFGWTAAEALGRNSSDILTRDETPEDVQQVIDAMRTGASWSGDFDVKARGGHRVPVRVTNRPVFDDDGRLVAVIGTCLDLTVVEEREAARVRADHELRVVQARYDAIVEHSSDVIMLFRPDFTIEWASPGTARLFGVEASDIIGRSGLDLIHPDDVDQCFADYLSMPQLGDHARSEFRYIDPSGELHWIEEFATNLVDDPRVGFTVGNLRDITVRKQMATELELQSRLLQAVGQGVVAVDTHQRIIFWNRAATDMYGWTHAEAIGRPISDLIAPEDGWDDIASELVDEMLSGRAWSASFNVIRKDGAVVPVLSTNTPVYDEAGELLGWMGVSSDETERNALLARVEDDRRRMRDAQRSAQLGSFELDTATGARSWSDELFRILGMDSEDVPEPDDVAFHVHPDDRWTYGRFREAFVAPDPSKAICTVRIVRPDGSVRWVELKATPRREGSGVISGTVLDVTDRAVAHAELEHRAHHDPLTDLPNRSSMSELLEDMLEHVDAGEHVALAFLDLDQFKVINDSLGHGVGDQILLAVADRLRESVEPGDVVGRFGGDEFIVLRRRCPGEAGALDFADGLRHALDAPIAAAGTEFALVASVGVALSRPGDVPATVLRDADAAMYHAKERGRNRAELFDEDLRRKIEEKLAMAIELRVAVDTGQLRLVYQPITSLATGAVVGFEALVRWDHPVRGELSPATFIPSAEETGLILEIGPWVLDAALTQLAAWRAAVPGADDLFISVNVSARELAHPNLVVATAAALAASGLPPDLVHLEITESTVMVDVDRSISTASALRALGLHLSIDDFGTGYSSLSYLKQLPVSTLKIDRSFVSGLGHHIQDRSIVEAIMALATALQLDVVAEGIETVAQAATLAELGCEFGQGYLWSRPVPPDEAIALVHPVPEASPA